MKNINKKVGHITKMPRQKFYISFGWNKIEAKKAARVYNSKKMKGTFARILNKSQYNKVIKHKRYLTKAKLLRLIKKR